MRQRADESTTFIWIVLSFRDSLDRFVESLYFCGGGDAPGKNSKKHMSQFAQIAHALNELADKKHATPDDVVAAGTDSDGAFERVVEELDAHKRRAVADATGVRGRCRRGTAPEGSD